jgi:hypothetical protein
MWDLFILPDGDTDSDWVRDEVSRPGIWNDFPDTVIAISMLFSKDEDISRVKNDLLEGLEAPKSSKLKERILPKTDGDDRLIDLLFIVLVASNG